MSSEQGFRGIPGVPDGWELVAIRRPRIGEYVMDGYGNPCRILSITGEVLAIIRKIEVPKKYRPFANGGEYVANRSHGIVDWKSSDTFPQFFSVVSANAPFVWVAFGKDVEAFDWQQAFERLVFRHADGTSSPFGVEITSENTTS